MRNLEDNFYRIEKAFEGLVQKQESDISKITKDFRDEKAKLSKSLKDLRAEVSRNIEGGIVLEVFGVGLFVIGVTYATIPDILAVTR